MSTDITIKNAVKKYGDNTIIKDLSLYIQEGEFFTLLGPSGCGKTTLLRMIAGFNTVESGDFLFGSKRVNDFNPAKRNIGMVFQNYAIFPHLTVRKNVEFGLKTRKLDHEKVKADTDEFLSLMQISEFADRLPDRLSGGQQQRVALARALVIRPDVLLMDEPLSNLDAKLRVDMRAVIKEIQNKLGITTVYVTHDQEEAMAVSDRIAVMNFGEIQQIGLPKDLYQRPKNKFVATFIGRTNLLDGELVIENNNPIVHFEGNYPLQMNTIHQDFAYTQKIIISIRPEDFTIVTGGNEGLAGTINDSIFLGINTHYFVTLSTGKHVIIIQESTIDSIIPKGSQVKLAINKEKINIFNEDGSQNLLLGSNQEGEVHATK